MYNCFHYNVAVIWDAFHGTLGTFCIQFAKDIPILNLKLFHALFCNTNMGHLIAALIERFLSGVLCPESIELVLLYGNQYKIV